MQTAGGYRDPGAGGGVCRSLRDPVFTGPMVPNHPLYKILSTLPTQMPTTVNIFQNLFINFLLFKYM